MSAKYCHTLACFHAYINNLLGFCCNKGIERESMEFGNKARGERDQAQIWSGD